MTPLATVAADLTPAVAPRWCPGCGNYAVLEQFKKSLAASARSAFVVAGVGCAGRAAHYLGVPGIPALPGRAFALALGLTLADPGRAVWVVTGDADAATGSGLASLARRNADVKVLILNNEVGGLARGAASPAARAGSRGSTADATPVNLLATAILAGATFAARAADVDVPTLAEVLRRASAHCGLAVVEVLQNCVTFHDDAWANVTDRNLRPRGAVTLAHGARLRFGPEGESGLRFRGPLLSAGPARDEDWVHDETADPLVGVALACLAKPLAVGVLRAESRPAFEWAGGEP